MIFVTNIEDKYTKITDNIFITQVTRSEFKEDLKPGHTSIMSCIAMPKELFFIDCGMNRAVAAEFRKDMEDHFRDDHLDLAQSGI